MPEPGGWARTRWARRGSVLALASMAWGCQSTTRLGDHYYTNGKLAEAAAAYRVYLDSETSDKEQRTRTLYRLGVIYGTSGGPAYDPKRSVATLEELLEDYPDSPLVPEASLLLGLQLQIVDLRRDLAADQVRLTELEVDLAERESELNGLVEQVGEKDEQIRALEESIPPLRIEVRELIRELAAKQQELEQLERLKAIDLDQPPP